MEEQKKRQQNKQPNERQYVRHGLFNIRWLLVLYDLICFVVVGLLALNLSGSKLTALEVFFHMLLAYGILFVSRVLWRAYSQVWRYGGVQSYMRQMLADGMAFVLYYLLQWVIPLTSISIIRATAFFSADLIVILGLRFVYRFVYKTLPKNSKEGEKVFKLLNIFGKTNIAIGDQEPPVNKIKIAIIGAGKLGTELAENLNENANSPYLPSCFVDNDPQKVGRVIYGISVLEASNASVDVLKDHGIQEVVFAIPDLEAEKKKTLYERYKNAGFKIKTYDYPTVQNAEIGTKRHLRDFEVEELLFRKPLNVITDATRAFYQGKVVLITGGGGSIGSELCRQIAKMNPKQIIILDIYENCAYDVQQELKMNYGKDLDLKVEILSITNKPALERVFAKYRPNIVVMAAAHKHVPLMENNIVEAVENNVFGTLNTVELAEKYGVDRVHMVSTDKAVNPTSVMGATKRICEMIVQSHSQKEQHTTFSATRFGNVLGSAGSVIPLFKRQIANGGPVTLTDYRIIRYFMTIPEASQLVLDSASMAKNGELFVLDMGQPVKIYDLAVNMIKLSGFEPEKDIKIIETGLRPGEKLYEELLVKTADLDKTTNKMIFIEKDQPISLDELQNKLDKLSQGIKDGDDKKMKEIIKQVVPTFQEKEKANEGFDGKERK